MLLFPSGYFFKLKPLLNISRTLGEGPRADSFADNLTGFETFWIFDSPQYTNLHLQFLALVKSFFQVLTTLLEYNQKEVDSLTRISLLVQNGTADLPNCGR